MSKSDFSVPAWQQAQLDFTAYIRHPELHQSNLSKLAVAPERMRLYRKLFYKNVAGFIRQGFPILYQILPKQQWEDLVQQFFREHRSQTPYFTQITAEFVDFLQHQKSIEQVPPYILELAHYEWAEIALDLDEQEICYDHIDVAGDLFVGYPIVSPLVWVLVYQYPVHRICVEFQPKEPPEQLTYLIVHRNQNDKVCFLEINYVTYRLLQLLQINTFEKNDVQKCITGEQAISKIIEELRHTQPDLVYAGGKAALLKMIQAEVILGTWVRSI